MTGKEIVQDLRCCKFGVPCEKCPVVGKKDCFEEVNTAAAELILQLRRLSDKYGRRDRMSGLRFERNRYKERTDIMKRNRKIYKVVAIAAAMLLALVIVLLLTACSEADKVNANISKQADYFESERRITVYNARTDKIILEAEGYMSISNNGSSELVVTCKVGPGEYKKNYIYLNDYTLYVVEDISGTHTDPYHYKMYFHTEFPVDVEVKP